MASIAPNINNHYVLMAIRSMKWIHDCIPCFYREAQPSKFYRRSLWRCWQPLPNYMHQLTAQKLMWAENTMKTQAFSPAFFQKSISVICFFSFRQRLWCSEQLLRILRGWRRRAESWHPAHSSVALSWELHASRSRLPHLCLSAPQKTLRPVGQAAHSDTREQITS